MPRDSRGHHVDSGVDDDHHGQGKVERHDGGVELVAHRLAHYAETWERGDVRLGSEGRGGEWG